MVLRWETPNSRNGPCFQPISQGLRPQWGEWAEFRVCQHQGRLCPECGGCQNVRLPDRLEEPFLSTQESWPGPSPMCGNWCQQNTAAPAGKTCLFPGTRGSIKLLIQPSECQHIISLPGRDLMVFVFLSLCFYLCNFHLDGKHMYIKSWWMERPRNQETTPWWVSHGHGPGCLRVLQGSFQHQKHQWGQATAEPPETTLLWLVPYPPALWLGTHGQLGCQELCPVMDRVGRKADATHAFVEFKVCRAVALGHGESCPQGMPG